MNDKIGLKRGTVILKKYHKEWARAFEAEKKNLQNLLGHVALDIQHIGSTAVPGLVAKPIIDILMAVKSLGDVSSLRPLLEKAGYEYRKNGSGNKQILFVKGPEELRTHYLHITELGGSVWQNDIAFRDYLRSHPKAVEEYQKIKEILASKYGDKREDYTAGKSEFIETILSQARK
jgi:GrpB-like predicted nucleotidyltransferase (UPF0157 family)